MKIKEVINNGVYSGKIVGCKCGAVYNTVEQVSEEDPQINSRRNYCGFCFEYVGTFDGSSLRRGPSFFWIFRKGVSEFKERTISRERFFIRSYGLIWENRVERIIKWTRGLFFLEVLSRSLKSLRERWRL